MVTDLALQAGVKKVKKKVKKNDEKPVQPIRRIVQLGFLLTVIWIGVEFVLFVHQLEQGKVPTVSRPPGVEAFLPISALISLRYWLLTGIFNSIHPSALVLLLIILGTAVFLKKGFCSWVCPFGLLSEYLAKLHDFLFGRRYHLPRWLDYPLRSLKYLLLLFFVWAIFVQMSVMDLHYFIYSPYNRVADIKMLKFFANMSSTTFWTLVILVLLSILLPPFWCRYLCPYGALLGVVSWISPFKVRRNEETCTGCEKCTKACPSFIPVHRVGTVRSDECHSCFQCIDACPVKDTLYLSTGRKKGLRLPKLAYAAVIVGLFIAGTGTARLLGRWQNSISTEEYLYHIKRLDGPEYFHAQGRVPRYDTRKFSAPELERLREMHKQWAPRR
jgi:polyferredoxin